MTNSPNQTPNPNRRRRLTADELIAIVVAMAGIGTVFFWGLGQKDRSINLLPGNANLGSESNTRKIGWLDRNEASAGRDRQTIATIGGDRDRQTPPQIAATNPVPPIVKTVEVPAETPFVPRPIIPAPVVVAPAVVTPAPAAVKPEFTDVPKQFWGTTYITELQKRGILDDFGTGKFDPSQPITRGEYAKMLDRAFADRSATTATANFKDIPSDYPRKEAIDKSVQLGFMSGYSPTKFSPNQTIPRYQMQISLAKGMKLAIPTSQDKVLSKFPDAIEMPKYAREKMAASVDAGLTIKDENKNLLKPVQNATRADAAALIYEALVKEGKIQPQQQQQP
jgi:hypothetical protein